MQSADSKFEKLFLSGDKAVALAALDANVKPGSGYLGAPSTEILEAFEKLGGRAQWAPNEKVAMEVGIGVAFAGARSLVTMKHVGLQVAINVNLLAKNARLIRPSQVEQNQLRNKKSLNVALLGVPSHHLSFPEEVWQVAIQRHLPEALHEANLHAFTL